MFVAKYGEGDDACMPRCAVIHVCCGIWRIHTAWEIGRARVARLHWVLFLSERGRGKKGCSSLCIEAACETRRSDHFILFYFLLVVLLSRLYVVGSAVAEA